MSTLIYEQLRHRANNLEKASARNRAPEKKKSQEKGQRPIQNCPVKKFEYGESARKQRARRRVCALHGVEHIRAPACTWIPPPACPSYRNFANYRSRVCALFPRQVHPPDRRSLNASLVQPRPDPFNKYPQRGFRHGPAKETRASKMTRCGYWPHAATLHK